MGALAFILRSRVGRYLAGALLLSALVFGAWRYAMSQGAVKERNRRNLDRLIAIKEKVVSDEKIDQMSVDDIRDKLRAEWMRDD